MGADLAPVFAPKLRVSHADGQVTLNWSLAVWMKNYVLKSTPSLQSPNWTDVPGVRAEGIDNQVTVPAGSASQFFAIVNK